MGSQAVTQLVGQDDVDDLRWQVLAIILQCDQPCVQRGLLVLELLVLRADAAQVT